MSSHHHSDRRRFLTDAALAGMAVSTAGAVGAEAPQAPPSTPAARLKETLAYGQPSRFDTTVRRTLGAGSAITDTALTTPLQDLDGIITPSGLHFLMDHVNGIPDIDPKQHRLLVHGFVARPLTFTLDELKRFPSVSKVYFLECHANSRPLRGPNGDSVQLVHGRTSCSEWTGVLLSTLLKEVGPRDDAKWVVAEGGESNKYTMSIPLVKAMDDILVAYAQNGEPVRPHNGYPLRLVVPGWEAIRSVKWLTRIAVVDSPAMSWHEAGNNADTAPGGRALGFRFELGPKSVITRPSGGQRLPGRGFYEITGLAWTGGGRVRRVDVSVDGGKSYKEAQLQDPVLPMAHTRFRFAWDWNGEEAVLQSRCTDDKGEVQPTIAEAATVLGVTPDYFLQADHFNGIQPWRVNRDGSIQNALL
jgi:sulfane dehydrogenase subunit SoxC